MLAVSEESCARRGCALQGDSCNARAMALACSQSGAVETGKERWERRRPRRDPPPALRERIAKLRDAPNQAFATGEVALLTEPIPGHEPADLASPKAPQRTESAGGLPPTLALCRACDSVVWPEEETCPHCGADLATAAASWEEDRRRRLELVAELERMMEEVRAAG